MPKCSIIGCNHNHLNDTLYRIPSDHKQRQLWFESLKNGSIKIATPYLSAIYR